MFTTDITARIKYEIKHVTCGNPCWRHAHKSRELLFLCISNSIFIKVSVYNIYTY